MANFLEYNSKKANIPKTHIVSYQETIVKFNI